MMIQWLFMSGYVLQNMLQVGFGKTFQNLPYFDQSVAYEDKTKQNKTRQDKVLSALE